MKWCSPKREAMLIGVKRLMFALLALPAVALLDWVLFEHRDWTWSSLARLALLALASGSLWVSKQPLTIRAASVTATSLVVAMATESIHRDTLKFGARLMAGLEVLLIGTLFFVPLCLPGRELFARRRAVH